MYGDTYDIYEVTTRSTYMVGYYENDELYHDDESYELDLHKENYEPDIKNALPGIPHAWTIVNIDDGQKKETLLRGKICFSRSKNIFLNKFRNIHFLRGKNFSELAHS